MRLNDQELATILAALRLRESMLRERVVDVEDIATNGGEFESLDEDQISDLCEKLNCQPNDAEVEVDSMLVLSTAHLSYTSAELMNRGETGINTNIEGVLVCPVEYGFLIRYWAPVGSEDRSEMEAGLRERHPSLLACILLAERHDCNRILFDQDGRSVECLELHNW